MSRRHPQTERRIPGKSPLLRLCGVGGLLQVGTEGNRKSDEAALTSPHGARNGGFSKAFARSEAPVNSNFGESQVNLS